MTVFNPALADELAPRDWWRHVGAAWTETERPCDFIDTWLDAWRLDIPHREAVMKPHERAYFRRLPECFTIWRGVSAAPGESPEHVIIAGISWTLRRSKAEWFARRFAKVMDPYRPHAYVGRGMVHKSAVFAYFSGRKESEVVVEPECVELEAVTRV